MNNLSANNLMAKNEIPHEEEWKYRECFSWFDKDQDGYISTADLPNALRSMGQFWTFTELNDLQKEIGCNKNINFSDFFKICHYKYKSQPNMETINRAFEIFDRKKKGKIFIDDLKHVMSTLGEKLSDKEFLELCKISGITYHGGDQELCRDDFLKL